MSCTVAQEIRYMLGRTTTEHDRLKRQGRLISKITRHFLTEMDLQPGMRVIDVGSGVGDVALIAAHMVGPAGEVVGIDVDESALQLARQRAASAGLKNVRFQPCDFHNYTESEFFDAVVGRCVLLHQQNPVLALRSLAKQVQPGGIIGFQEPCFSRGFSCPKAPLFEEVITWLHASVRASGLDADIGLRLASIFTAATLPIPNLSFEMLVERSGESEIWQFVVDTVRSLLPTLEQLEIVSPARVQLETLEQRLRREQIDLGSVIGVMPLMGAWCRKL